MGIIQGKALLALVTVTTLVVITVATIKAGGYFAALSYVMTPTAHAAFAFFWMAFSASSIHTLAPGTYSRWAMKNRRYIGLSFAAIHFIHLILVLSSIILANGQAPLIVFIGGAPAYIILLLMALTSNNAAIKKLGKASWSRLHRFGSWYIWIIFVSSLPEVMQGKYNRVWIFAFCITVLILRMLVYRKKHLTAKTVA